MHKGEIRQRVAGAGAPERSRSEEALHESRRAFRELLELAPDAVLVGDNNHRVVDANTAACKLFRCSREELIGAWFPGLDSEERERYLREVRPEPGLVHRGEWRLRRYDGTVVPVDATLKVLPSGGAMVFVRDISDRKLAERLSGEAMQWMAAVFEQSPFGLILVHGANGERLELNARAQEMLGEAYETTFADFAGRRRLRTLDGQPTPFEALPLAAALRGERSAAAEFLASNAAGGLTPIAVGAAPILDPEGAVIGAVAAFEDITRRRSSSACARSGARWSLTT